MSPALALTLMLKVITYDNAFARTGEGAFVVLVPYAGADREQADEVVAAAETLAQKMILHRSLKFVPVKADELSAKVGEQHASAVLMPSGAPASLTQRVVSVAAAQHIYSLAMDPERVDDGIALGVATNNGKPQLIINITSARAEGCEFQPSVLKVAKTVQ
jgi:hypothetical protein